MFVGAYAYNALCSFFTGREAAFDPIRIIQELLGDIFGGDDEEEKEPTDIIMNFADNIADELPFVSTLTGGGRIPISSALPYGDGLWQVGEGTFKDLGDKDWKGLTKEWLNPLVYLVSPMAGGQIKKTAQGLSMFLGDKPVSGSYTDKGDLRFPVEKTPWNVGQAALFGQWSSENAREYFDEGRSPLNEKQIGQLIDSGWTIEEYWDYQDEMKRIGESIDAGTATDDEILTYKYMSSDDADFANYKKVEYDEFGGVRYAKVGDVYYDWHVPGEDAEDQTPRWRKLNDEQVAKYKATKNAGKGIYAEGDGVQYRYYTPEDGDGYWKKISEDELARQDEVVAALGITPKQYWEHRRAFGELSDSVKAGTASDDDILNYKFVNSVTDDISELRSRKEKLLEMDFSEAEKKKKLAEIDAQIRGLYKLCSENYGDIEYDDFGGEKYAMIGTRFFKWHIPTDDGSEREWYEEEKEPYWRSMTDEETTKYLVTSSAPEGAVYATNGADSHYRWYVPEDSDNEPCWKKISEDELKRQNEVTAGLGITPEDYWSRREEYTYAYENPSKYQVARASGGYDAYREYSSALYDIKSDKDEDGKTINGSAKKKRVAYLNSLNIEYGQKLILFKSAYPADDRYNFEIVEYLNGREDISYSEMKTILLELGFKVSADGRVTWD